MRKIKKLPALMLIMAAAVCFLSACRQFDYSGYIQAMLDSTYKNEHTQYALITKSDKNALVENYNRGISAEIETFLSYMGIHEHADKVSAQTRSAISDMYQKIYRYANYTVSSTSDGSVTVTISPINIFDLADEELNAYIADFYSRNDNKEFAQLSDEAFYSAYIEGMIDIINKYIPQIGYLDTVSITVHVKPDDNNIYGITSDEFQEIDKYIIDYPS